MERRSFLALLASAPIAALAPLPHFLPRVIDVTNQFTFDTRTVRQLERQLERPHRFVFNTKTGRDHYEFLD